MKARRLASSGEREAPRPLSTGHPILEIIIPSPGLAEVGSQPVRFLRHGYRPPPPLLRFHGPRGQH